MYETPTVFFKWLELPGDKVLGPTHAELDAAPARGIGFGGKHMANLPFISFSTGRGLR
jgi:hypothetical protein